MNEFIGLVIYPFLFSTSFRLTSTGRFTHSSMFLTGMFVMSLVNILKGAVSFGVLSFSLFPALFFRGLGAGFGFDFAGSGPRGELDGAMVRPLRVRLWASSTSCAECGVGGDPEYIACESFLC